jgi:hypothetical protein
MPEKLCECGLWFASADCAANVPFKGYPARFIKGHNRKETTAMEQVETTMPAPAAPVVPQAAQEPVAAPVASSPAPVAPEAAGDREQELTNFAASKRELIHVLEQQVLDFELVMSKGEEKGIQPANSLVEPIDKQWARACSALKRARVDLLAYERDLRAIRLAKERDLPPPDPRAALKEKIEKLKGKQ